MGKPMKRDPPPESDAYEEGEIGMGGVANTYWVVNPVRDMVTLCFTNAIDSKFWEADKKLKSGGVRVCPANFTVAVRDVVPRNGTAAALPRTSLTRKAKTKKK